MKWPEIEFRKLDEPEYFPGSYSLYMYCDHENQEHDFREFPHSYSEGCETGGQARAIARREGWVIHRDYMATCPKCVRRLKGGQPC